MTRRDFLGSAAALSVSGSLDLEVPGPSVQTEAGFVSLFDGVSLNGWTVADGADSAFYVNDGAIVVHESEGFPAWLRSARQYENFDFRGEFFVKGWIDSGIYLHAPEHGRNTWCGMKIHIFHQVDAQPAVESMGSIFPIVAPLKVNVKNQGEWNTFRILMDWPRLQVWTNEEMIQDLDIESTPELRRRFRKGYLGFESLSYPIRFRNLRVKELPSKEKWQILYGGPADFDKWQVSDGRPNVTVAGDVLHANGKGLLATKETFRDFELQLYVRHAKHHNGGVLFRAADPARKIRPYEIQLHDVEGAHYPTGSLY